MDTGLTVNIPQNNVSTGYEDIDKLNQQQNNLYNQMYNQQQNIINTQTEQNIAEIERNKQKLQEETTKTNKGLYSEYQKQVNPYGATAESLLANGLANSGVAETTKTNLYNTYQKNRTETLNTAKSLLADYNNKITQARQNGDMQLAQSALDLYTMQMDNLYKNYQLIQDKEQFQYQKDRDVIADKQWQDEFDYNKYIDNRNYDYQVERNKIADSQWQQEFNLSKKKASSGSSRSGAYKIPEDSKIEYTPSDILSNITMIQGPNVEKPIKDNISGKTFSNTDELLAYYGYASIE